MRRWIVAALCTGLGFAAGIRAEGGFGPSAAPAAGAPFKVAGFELIPLHDAQYVIPNDGKTFGVDAGAAAVAATLKAGGLEEDRLTLSVNALLVRGGGRSFLLDTGLGPSASGALTDSLTAAGVRPGEVTDVLLTHSHGDHAGGLADATGHPAFPNATIRMAAAEWNYMKGQAGSAALVKAIEGRVTTFTPGAEIVPGIRSVALEGHTPGHVGYEIGTGPQRLLDIGDLAHSSLVSLQRPGWTMGFDGDSAVAKATRFATFARLAKDREWVFAPHFPFPGLGHVAAAGDAFIWVPGTP